MWFKKVKIRFLKRRFKTHKIILIFGKIFNIMSSFIDFGIAKKSYDHQQNMNKITELFNIKYPIIQGGMIWHSGWRLASAVSNNGGLGLIGSASMYPDIL